MFSFSWCWRGHISHYSKYVLSSTLSIYNTLIAIVLRDYDVDYLFDHHLFYDGAVDIQRWTLLTRSQYNVYDTYVTVKALGPLVCFPVVLKALLHGFHPYITFYLCCKCATFLCACSPRNAIRRSIETCLL